LAGRRGREGYAKDAKELPKERRKLNAEEGKKVSKAKIY
jgi:hypothetical protein